MIARRQFIQSILSSLALFKVGLLFPSKAFAAWPVKLFSIESPEDTLLELFGVRTITASDKIHIEMPPGAENGAIVPITIKTDLEKVKSISLIAEKNPVALLAQFSFNGKGSGEYLRSRIKLAKSSYVLVVIEADCELFSAKQNIEVLKGGCD